MVNFVRGGTRIYAAVEGKKSGLESGPQAVPAGDQPGDNHLSALLKLIPAEVVSIYMAIRDKEIAWRFQRRNAQQQMYAGPMAMGPNTVNGDARGKQQG
jgi:hypothetical protein